MPKVLFAGALLGGVIWLAATPANAIELQSEACTPLTNRNAGECCAADNWRDLIPSDRRSICLQFRERNDLFNAQGPDGPIDPPGDPDPQLRGNPGNAKQVGSAGEKGMDNESPPTGTRGNSPNN